MRLAGDFDAVHTAGDNAPVLPTDTMRGTCFALARDGIDSVARLRAAAGRPVPRGLARRPRRCGSGSSPSRGSGWRSTARRTTTPSGPAAGGQPVAHPDPGPRRRRRSSIGGVRGARVLKTTGSAFSGYLEDEYTTLPPTRDRIMATTIDADVGDHLAATSTTRRSPTRSRRRCWRGSRPTTTASRSSTRCTRWARRSSTRTPDVTWIRFRLPNEHHILADLSRLRAGQPERGLPRRRPPVRRHRGHGRPRGPHPGARLVSADGRARTPTRWTALLAGVEEADARRRARGRASPATRQPVQVLYVPARPDPPRHGRAGTATAALRLLEAHAPDGPTLARGLRARRRPRAGRPRPRPGGRQARPTSRSRTCAATPRTATSVGRRETEAATSTAAAAARGGGDRRRARARRSSGSG